MILGEISAEKGPTEDPTVSLVIAAYNRGPKIASTLDSVLSQTRVPDEIIVVDDGSADGTGEWVAAHYPRVIVSRIENSGPSAARNKGASIARGNVLVFLDSDDEMLPHAVATLLAELRDFPEARAAIADHEYHNLISGLSYLNHHEAQGAFARLKDVPHSRAAGKARVYEKPLYYAQLQGNLLQQPWAIHRETFEKIGGFNTDIWLVEDWELYTRIVRDHPIVLTDEVISRHFVEPGKHHMHLDDRQIQMQSLATEVLRGDVRGFDPKAVRALRRQAAGLHKWWGDNLRDSDLYKARYHYVKSLIAWPFDHVVWARVLIWSGSLGLRGKTAR